jgi:hypothetical protein
VPRIARIVLALALAVHIAWQALGGKPQARGASLPPSIDPAWLHVVSLGEPIVFSQVLVLYLQAFDNQPGLSIPYTALDYGAVLGWLRAARTLDPRSHYPLMMAAQLYAQVPDARKARLMLDFVHEEFLRDPDRHWRWLAHGAIVAKHRLNDLPLALRYAEDISRHAPGALSWARQMRIFLLEDLGESQAAAVLLGGLLANGEVTDPAEARFLTERLERLKADENSSLPSKSR